MWQEQVSPDELALLQSRARTIARSAGRRNLRDLPLSLLATAAVGMILWLHPTSLWITLGLVPIGLLPIWGIRRRHQVAKAALAIAVDHPRAFFETAIDNVRADLRLSRISLVAGPPIFVITLWLAKASGGVDFGVWFLRLLRDINVAGVALLAIVGLVYALFLREHLRLRAQLRRLEAMQREWEEQEAGPGLVQDIL